MNWQILDQQGAPMPVTEPQILGLIRQGTLKRSTLMWCEGMDDWMPAAAARPDLFPTPGGASHMEPPPVPPSLPGPPPVPAQPVYAPVSPGVRPTYPQQVSYAAPRKKSSGGKILLVVCLVLAAGFAVSRMEFGPKAPGYLELKKAEKLMSGSVTKGFGETKPEEEAADSFAKTCQMLRQMTITSSKQSSGRGKSGLFSRAAAGMDGDGFTAVCTVQGQTAVFLLHVPDLRKFNDEAKTTMGEMAWFAARMAVAEMEEPRPARITVGVKGIVNHDRVLEGRMVAVKADESDESEDLWTEGLEKTTSSDSSALKILCSYFAADTGTASKAKGGKETGNSKQPAGEKPEPAAGK